MVSYKYHAALAPTPPDAYATVRAAEQQSNYLNTLSSTINNHAAALNELNARMGNAEAFIEWVGATYPEVVQEYSAIKDIEKASV